MQISMNILMIGALHMLLMIAVAYMLVFAKMHYSISIKGVDVFIPAIQVINLVLLLHFTAGYGGGLTAGGVYSVPLFILQGIFASLILIRLFTLLRKVQPRRGMLLIPQSVREAIDYLPGGICFSTQSGRPVLTNYRMNELVYGLTGHTIINAQNTWEELCGHKPANGCLKLEDSFMIRDDPEGDSDEILYFQFPDGRIRRFRREELADRAPHYIQLEVTDITDLYRYSKELYENNQRLATQFERRQNLLDNIVDINHEKEILQAKIRIHDDLGRSILTTKQHLWSHTLSGNIRYLADVWNNTIRNLEEFSYIGSNADISPEIEMQRAAEMIGCRINFTGERPVSRKTALLFYAAVREALTNAVTHAKADQLNVSIDPTINGYRVVISDNGVVSVPCVSEGGGLSDLRRRLEQEGATMEVKCDDGVVLIVQLPAD